MLHELVGFWSAVSKAGQGVYRARAGCGTPVTIEVKEAEGELRVLGVRQEGLEVAFEEALAGQVAAGGQPAVLGRVAGVLIELLLQHVLELHAAATVDTHIQRNAGCAR